MNEITTFAPLRVDDVIEVEPGEYQVVRKIGLLGHDGAYHRPTRAQLSLFYCDPIPAPDDLANVLPWSVVDTRPAY